MADLNKFGTENEATRKEFDIGFDPGTIQVFYNERDGLRNLIFPEPRDRDTSYFMRRGDITMNKNDQIYQIKLEEDIQVVGFYAKLRNTEVVIENDTQDDESAENLQQQD